MGEQLLIQNYEAGGNLSAHRFVKTGVADGEVVAAGVGDVPFGITDRIGSPPSVPAAYTAVAGDRVDVVQEGVTDLELGDDVAFGEFIVPGANGVGMPYDAGDPQPVGARAQESGGLGDLIRVKFVEPLPGASIS